MASGFPGSIDSFTNPLTTSALNSPSHAGQHQDLNDAVNKIETYMGLVKVASFSVTAGTTLACDNVFSSLYRSYRVVMEMTGTSNGNTWNFQYYDTAGTLVTTGYYSTAYGQDFTSGSTTFQTAADTTKVVLGWLANGSQSIATLDIVAPYVAAMTKGVGQQNGINSGAWYAGGAIYHVNTLTQAVRGFRIANAIGSNMTGTCVVYGYRN